MAGLNKAQKKIASSASSAATARWKARSRSERMTGLAAAVSAGVAESQLGEMLPDIPEAIPVVGGKYKIHTAVGALLAARYALAKSPSKMEAIAGWAGAALLVRAL